MPGGTALPGEAQRSAPNEPARPQSRLGYVRDKYIAENVCVRPVCRVGPALPARRRRRVAKLVTAAAAERDLDRSQRPHLLQPAPRALRRDGVRHAPPRPSPTAVEPRPRADGATLLVPIAVPDRGPRVGRRRHPAVDRLRPGERVDRGAPVPRRAVRGVLPGRRADHGRLRRAPALGQAPLPVGGDAARAVPASGTTSLAAGRARSGRDVPQRVPRPRARGQSVHSRIWIGWHGLQMRSRTIRRVQERRRTTTSNFGVSRRESHDASGFYGRFEPPRARRRRDACRRRRRSTSRSCAATPATCTRSPTASSRSSSRRRPTSPASSTRRSSSATACRARTSSTSSCSHDVFAECVARARARRPDRRQRRQPRPQAVPQPVGRRRAHPAGPSRPAAARRDRLAEGRRRQRVVRVGLVPQRLQPGAARS